MAAHAPSGLAIDDLSVLGPLFVLKLKLPKKTFSRRIVVEMWLYPDGSRILELSTKCLPDEGLAIASRSGSSSKERASRYRASSRPRPRQRSKFFSAELMTERRGD